MANIDCTVTPNGKEFCIVSPRLLGEADANGRVELSLCFHIASSSPSVTHPVMTVLFVRILGMVDMVL